MTNHTYTARIYAPEGFVVRMTVSDWKTLDQIALNTKCKTLHIDVRRFASKELVCEQIGDAVFLLSDEPQLSGETKELVFNRTV